MKSFVPALRNEETGCLDAIKVSQMFGLTVTDIDDILGRDKSSVSKTPDSENIQPGLHVFERIAAMLLSLVKQPEQLRMWMNAPNKEFNGKTPMEYMQEGLGEIVAQRLENALSGLPA